MIMKTEVLRQIGRLTVALGLGFGTLSVALADEKETREFYIKTVHIDGKGSVSGDASHPPEPFPEYGLPDGGGLILKRPDENGRWKVRAFAFVPSQIVVNEGDDVKLHFVGVQGPKHDIHVEGGEIVDEKFVLKRGHVHDVSFQATKPGVIQIECYTHEPAMNGEIVILPKAD